MYDFYLKTGRKWAFKSSEPRVPTYSEFEALILELKAAISEGNQVETGGLIVAKHDKGHTDLYVHVGEI